MEQKPKTEENRMKIATKVAEEIKKGGITEEAIKNFRELMGSERLEKLASRPSHFETAPLPDDDW